MTRLIECVPNFSEGRDMAVIRQITDAIERVDGVKLLDVDPGATTNRTVVTFVGTPDEVVEAAFQAARKAQELIDMRGPWATIRGSGDRRLPARSRLRHHDGRDAGVRRKLGGGSARNSAFRFISMRTPPRARRAATSRTAARANEG